MSINNDMDTIISHATGDGSQAAWDAIHRVQAEQLRTDKLEKAVQEFRKAHNANPWDEGKCIAARSAMFDLLPKEEEN